MSEGKAVNAAYNGPSIDHDALIDQIEARNREDKNRASSAGESRQKIGEFLEETSMNSKAFGWCRQILKVNDKDDGQHKAMDIIASLKKALPMIESHVAGQGTMSMEFDVDESPDEPADESVLSDGLPADAFENDAFGRGGAAYENGASRDGNPFDADAEMAHHQLWNKGWEEARDEDVAENFEDIEAKTTEPVHDLDEETVDELASEMDDDLEETPNVVQPHFGGGAA